MAALLGFQVERTLRTLVAKVPHTIATSRVSVAQTVQLTENVVGLLDAASHDDRQTPPDHAQY